MPTHISAPNTNEYATFYNDYIQRVIAKKDIAAALPQQIEDINSVLGKLSDEQARFRFGAEEWSIKELVGHLNDTEQIFSYRLLRISRNDQTPLPGFEQEEYVREAGFDNSDLSELIHEFELLRRANILSIKNMSEAAILRTGTASGATVSARALIHMLVGHVDHHMASLHENYLPALK